MIYAIIGMPLFLLYLANIGNIMATSFKWTYTRCFQCRSRRKRRSRYGSGSLSQSRSPTQSFQELPGTEMLGVGYDGGGGGHVPEEHDSMFDEMDEEDDLDAVVDGNEVVAVMDDGEFFHRRDDRSYSGVPVHIPDTDDEDDVGDLSRVTVPFWLSLTIMVSYIAGGAVLFAEWEGWGLLDGSYFCFITLSTIGFGDFVPGASLEAEASGVGGEDGEDGEAPLVNPQFIFCSMYILLGMAVIAMCFNLMQEKVVFAITSLAKKLGIIKPPGEE